MSDVILTHLTATAAAGEHRDGRGTITCIHDEPTKGFFRQIRLDGTAITIRQGAQRVVLPLVELLALAETHCPALHPPQLIAETEGSAGRPLPEAAEPQP